MTPSLPQPKDEIVIAVPTPDGCVWEVVIALPRRAFDHAEMPAPMRCFDRGAIGAKQRPDDAPIPPPNGEYRGKAPDASPRNGASAPHREVGLDRLSARADSTGDRDHNLHDDLRDLRSFQAELMAEFSDLQDELAESDGEEASIRRRLVATHGGAWDFSPAARQARASLFERNVQLAETFGRRRIRRRDLTSTRKTIARLVEATEREIQKQDDKRRRRAS